MKYLTKYVSHTIFKVFMFIIRIKDDNPKHKSMSNWVCAAYAKSLASLNIHKQHTRHTTYLYI